MRISELARRSGVTVPTIKFYLRERLLPEGHLTSKTQAQYDESHLARLRLVRALLGPGGLSIVAARSVLDAIDDPPDTVHALLGAAAVTLRPPADEPTDHERVHELMRRWGWTVSLEDCATTHSALAEALSGLEAAEFELPDGLLDTYVRLISELADAELAGVPTESAAAAVRYVVLGTVLVEPLLLVLRRMAQQEASARRYL